MLLSLALALTIQFTDVSERYADPVEYLTANNITQGVTDTQFGTHEHVKRGDAAVMLARHLKLAHIRPQQMNHTDVSNRLRPHINALWERNIINDMDKFRPDEIATRSDIAEWLTNTYEYGLTDIHPHSYVYNVGLMVGDANGMRWDDGITRGEYAIILKRANDILGEYKDLTTN